MNVLIFRTANDLRMTDVIENYIYDTVYVIVPNSKVNEYKKRFNWCKIIPTDAERMNYINLKKEKRVPELSYDIVVIPSSFSDNLYSFGQVLAYLTEINVKQAIWISPQNEVENLLAEINFENNLRNRMPYYYFKIWLKFYKIKDKIAGNQW